jgi:ferredoxin-NADP reductase
MDKLLEVFHLITDLPRILSKHKFEFVKKENDTGNIWSFYFKPPAGFSMKAGEHLLLKLDHENTDKRGNIRFYSPASAPHEDLVRVTTRYFGEESSSFKRAKFAMEAGDTINVMGPIGKFTVNDLSKEYVFIAGGVGITPFRSILLDLDRKSNFPEVSLFYFNSGDEVLFQNDLDKLAENNPNLSIHYLNKESEVPENIIDQVNSKKGMFYIAGAPKFVEGQKTRLKTLGTSAFRIKFDPFKSAKEGK